MLNREIMEIIASSRTAGWVLEPEAKRILLLTGIEVPRFIWAREEEDAVRFAREAGYPVAAKIVSPEVLHKSERDGVALGIKNDQTLLDTFKRFSRIEGFAGILVEEMVSGVELIVGAKVDYQFGPVILLGIGGTGVEIYRDVALRMAPLIKKDTESMIKSLKAHQMLEGYRGSHPVRLEELERVLLTFSALVMDLEKWVASIDLNPVMCSGEKCVVADARIILKP